VAALWNTYAGFGADFAGPLLDKTAQGTSTWRCVKVEKSVFGTIEVFCAWYDAKVQVFCARYDAKVQAMVQEYAHESVFACFA